LIPRSYLYVPGDQPHKLERATRSGADAVIADLEDAVAPSAKTAARNTLADWLATLTDTNRPEIWVRVNASPLMAEDVSIVIGPPLAGLCLPKVGRLEQILSLDDLVTAGEQRGGFTPGSIRVLPLLESAAGILSAQAIAKAPRVTQVGLGELDLCGELGIEPSPDEPELLPIRLHVVLASAAARLEAPVAPVSTDYRDLDALRRSTQALERLGFGSRWAIHPAQVPIINEVFTPTAGEVSAAQRLIEQHEAALAAGRGVFVDDHGRMADEAVVRSARRILARARQDGQGTLPSQRRSRGCLRPVEMAPMRHSHRRETLSHWLLCLPSIAR
jgi:citrate lyase subunit beta / citryl-CoA lyase